MWRGAAVWWGEGNCGSGSTHAALVGLSSLYKQNTLANLTILKLVRLVIFPTRNVAKFRGSAVLTEILLQGDKGSCTRTIYNKKKLHTYVIFIYVTCSDNNQEYASFRLLSVCSYIAVFFNRQRARYLYKKRSKFVKNEHARYTIGMKKGKNLERLITATSQARF